MRRIFILCAVFTTLLSTGGCVRYPADYSPHYQAVSLGPPATRTSRERFALVPEACLMAEPTSVKIDQGRLPPGCANAQILVDQLEQPLDPVRPRRLGPAQAGPTVRAAAGYVDGEDSSTGAGTGPSVKGRGTTQEEPVTAPRNKNPPATYAGTSR